MRRLLLVLLIALAAAPDAPAAARQHPICGPAKARTVAKTHRLRVYSVPGRYGWRIEYVCSKYSKRRWALEGVSDEDDDCGSSQGCSGRTRLLVAGRWVLEVITHSGNDTYSWIYLRAAGARSDAAFTRVDHLDDIVLHPGGGVAWIATNHQSYDPPVSRTFVGRFDGCGETTLDEGDDIESKSLALAGEQATWLRGGAAKTGELCPP